MPAFNDAGARTLKSGTGRHAANSSRRKSGRREQDPVNLVTGKAIASGAAGPSEAARLSVTGVVHRASPNYGPWRK